MKKRSITTVRKIGSSYGVIIPIEFLRAQNFQRGDELVVSVFGDDTLVLRKFQIIN